MNDFQQTFLRWLDLNRKDIVIPPIFEEFEERTKALRYRFEHLISNIALYVSPYEIRVDAFKGTSSPYQAWATLFRRAACKLDACRPDGYFVNGLICTEHERRCHAPEVTRESILREHCFEPLFAWIVNELKPAYWLLFGESEYGTTSARLQIEDELKPASEDDGSQYERLRLYSRRR